MSRAPAWLVPMTIALSLGLVGGFLFDVVGAPMPWILGAMFANMIAAMAGIEARVPPLMMVAMLGVLGVMSGSSFGPEFLERIPQWTGSLTVVVIFVFSVAGTTYYMLRRYFGYSMLNAYFCSSPGGLTMMSVIGQSMGGDVRDIALVHSTRLALTLAVIGFWLTVTGHPPVDALAPTPGGYSIGLVDALLLVGCAVVGVWLAERFKMDGGHFIGPMILSAAIHMAGLTEASAPNILAAVAQVTLGANIGARFGGTTIKRVVVTIYVGALTAVIALGCAIALTAGLSGPLDVESAALLLSLAPAGFPMMVLAAIALKLDVAFVTIHQLARVVIIVFIGPPLIRYIARRSGLTLRDSTYD
jgi:membrane AbrB-like protein